MPYKFNNSANQYSLEYDNPILRTEISTGISDMVKKYSQPLSRYPIKIDNNNFKINTPYQESINQQSQPKKATTFAEGFDAWKQNFINNMNYIGSSIEKEASGDNYIKSAVNSLQNSYNGDLLAQPNDVLRSKIKEIEKGLYQVPFPSMSPTHALSLQQPLKMEEIVKKNIMNDIITKRESGYDDAQIADWLENLYDNGTEASARHREVLKEAENIPQTEGWGTVGSIAGGLLGSVPAILGSAVSPALGFALGGATLGNNLAQSIAGSNKEIDLYEKNTNTSVPSWARKGYVAGASAADLALDAIMQSQYLKHLNLPIAGELRKTLPKKLLNNTQAMHKYNDLFRHSFKQSVPGIMKNTGTLAAEQAAASGLSSASKDLMSYAYKNPEHYPEINDILENALTEAMIGAGTGLVSGGVASGLGTLMKPHRSKRSFKPYKLNLPENPIIDIDGLSLRGYMDRENKIKQIIKENYKSNQPKDIGIPEYSLNLPDNPLFDLGDMSLKEYNKIVPQLRSALKDFYMQKPTQSEPNLPGKYRLKLPENPIIDLEGLSLRDWTERENRIRSILGENYQPQYHTLLHEGPINLQDKVRTLQLTEDDMKKVRIIPTAQYSNSLKRIAADDIAKSMNMKIRMFDDISSLPAEYKKYLDDHSRSKGFYNHETDEVVVIGNNIENEVDLQNLLVQKGYSSKGLEGVLGKELDNLLDDVYNNMSNRDSAKYSDKGKTSRGTALSYISDLSKNPQINPEEWNRLSTYVRELFKNKYNVQNLTDETIQNLLWRTGNQITGDDSIEEMIRKSK
ncbi:MAG: hypothetical protein IKY54_06365 [Muribaculaceae bacterium]|nr:hypothetical protein [Muribaculaceae bacterium]